MGLRRVIAERDFWNIAKHYNTCLRRWRDFSRGWNEQDLENLNDRLHNPSAYSSGIVNVTSRQFRALPERNRRIAAASKGRVTVSPLLIWVEGRGLFPALLKE